jgi:hypothetical protein
MNTKDVGVLPYDTASTLEQYTFALKSIPLFQTSP